MKKRLLAFLLLMGAGLAHAQMVTVLGNNTADSSRNLATGVITFTPLLNGAPTSYNIPGLGTATQTPISVNATSGKFSVQLPDVTLTTPTNICFKAQLKTFQGLGFSNTGYCLQPHYTATSPGDWCQAGICNLDNYLPNIANGTAVVGVLTINGIGGPFTFSGPGISCTNQTCIVTGSGSSSIGDSDVVNQIASQGTVNLVGTVPASGKYRISYYVDQNVLCSSGMSTVLFTFNWTDATHTRSINSIALTLGAAASPSSTIQGVIPVYALASSAMTYTSTITGACATGGPASYDAHISVEAVQ